MASVNSTTSSPTTTSMNRITGLASGLDIDSMVGQLMNAHKIPLNKLNQQKQLLTWRQDGYREINTSLTKLRDLANQMSLQGAYKINSATSSRPDIAAVSAGGAASAGNYAVTVRQLATSATITSTTTLSPELVSSADIDFSTPPLDLKGKDFKITFGDTTKTISWSSTDISGEFADITALVNGLQAKINDAFGTNQITIAQVGVDNKISLKPANSGFLQRISIADGTASPLAQLKLTPGASSQLTLNTSLQGLNLSTGPITFDGSGKLQFTINGQNFSIDKSGTVQDLINMVNGNANANVKLEYLASQDKFVMTRKDTGAGKNITVSDTGGTDFFAKLNLGAQVNGKNAIYDYTKNGAVVNGLESPENSFNLDGISFSFKKADPGTEVTFTVSKDTDKAFDSIKKFVDQYNETLELINNKLGEKRYREYKPLSDDQKKEMKDKDVDLWEEKAKSGLLAGDSTLSTLAQKLRSMWVTPVSGAKTEFDQLTEIGIKTGYYMEGGKLTIDESKLKAALNSNLEEVTKFFTGTANPLTGGTISGNIDLSGKDFNLKLGGMDYKVSLNGAYDLNTAGGQQSLINELQAKVDAAIKPGNITVTLNTQKQLEFSTIKPLSFEVSNGAINALGDLGMTSGAKYDFYQRGIASRLYRQTSENVTTMVKQAGLTTLAEKNSPLVKELNSLDDRIKQMNKKLLDYEDRYYRQFSAMESALNKMNQQSSYFMSQFNGQ